MKPLHLYTLLLIICIRNVASAQVQQPAFYHLSTAEGLSDNQVNSIARDQQGVLWLGTLEGLNSFDGYSITTYYKEQYPALQSNQVLQVVCDDKNRIWLRTDACRLTMLDERRQFHSIPVGNDSSNSNPVRHLVLTRKYGVLALKGNCYYYRDENNLQFTPLATQPDSILPQNINYFIRYGEDKVLYTGNNKLVVANFSRISESVSLPFDDIDAAAPLNDNELIAFTTKSNTLYRINWRERTIKKVYRNLHDQYGRPMSSELRSICRINEHQFVITARFSGVYLFDVAAETVTRWHHDPLDPRSLGGDNTSELLYDSSGYVYIMSRTTGAHYFNTRQQAATYKSYFATPDGKVFDGYIQCIAMAGNGRLWIGTQDRLICWDRAGNNTRFVNYRLSDGRSPAEETIRSLAFDKSGLLWVGTTRYGLLLIDSNGATRKHIAAGPGSPLPSNWITSMAHDKNGDLWIGTLNGLCKMNANTWEVISFRNHPVLKKLSGESIWTIWFDHSGKLWIGTYGNAWCYDSSGESLQQHPISKGLANERAVAFNEDRYNNIYIGSMYGLTVLRPDGSRFQYNRTNGLRNDKCEGILRDEEGQLWICNQRCILRFDPATQHFAVLEEGQGFSHGGFRMRSCYKSPDGEFFWASDKGLYYFFPQQLHTSAWVQPSVQSIRAGDTTYRFTQYDSLVFPAGNRSYTFRFISGDLSAPGTTQFQYRLAGYEREWHKPFSPGQAFYSALPPGKYRLELKASRDGKQWYPASYAIAITILKPWWERAWFKLCCVATVLLLTGSIYWYAQKKERQREIRKMINYFAHSGYDQSSVTDILWDICRNCIASLRFEDCVIYLLDEERNVLVQKAAYGPKSTSAYEIVNPIEIPVGKGIVGTVAVTGQPVIVADTSKDERYIVDDMHRLSEITVPLIHEGKVIGIIDAEHQHRNFFTRQHLHALQTIASLCSAKIARAIAVEAMKKSRMELMELNVKMAESKFLHLRLQMNPHFLFNSLSAIQSLIVSQQTTRAYKYLTVFSHFLRSLLDYADKNFITLDEEVTLLRMYMQLESLRFDSSFRYDIQIDDSLGNEEIWIPPLLVQPFAENAIWHGLMHKQGEKKLDIRFTATADDNIMCTIEDNGIGRHHARTLQHKKLRSVIHKSKGIHIVEERLQLLQQKTGKPARVAIEDLFDDNLQPAGTRIIIIIPFYNAEEL